MQLVVLAAGHGRRFGGLKQLAPVGPRGEAIMDYTAADALAAGFGGVVLIVRSEVRDELLDHIKKYWPAELEVEPLLQGPVAGTAQAVASARPAVSGSFAVVNADDLYGAEPLSVLARQIGALEERTHVAIGYRLGETVVTDAPVTRGICETAPSGDLLRIVEQSVVRTADGFSGQPLESRDGKGTNLLSGTEIVSMNLWGFDESIFGDLQRAIETFDGACAPDQPGKPPELLLPSVVGDLVRQGSVKVRVTPTAGRCIGLTHPDDLALVRDLIAAERRDKSRATPWSSQDSEASCADGS
ncbi:MAG: NTP transferase domain-containing protein [Acidimicrobiales bacterium]